MKKTISTLIKLAITSAFFYMIFSNLEFKEILDHIQTASIPILFVGFFTLLISNVLGAFQWTMLLSGQDVKIKFKDSLNLYFTGLFFNNVMPGSLGGDFVKIYSLKKILKRGKEGLAATFVDRFMGLFVLSIFSLLSSFYLYFFSDINFNKNIALYIFVLFGVFIISIIFLFSRRFYQLLYNTILIRVNLFGIREKIMDLHSFLHIYRAKPKLLFRIFFISTSIQLLRVLVHFFMALAIGFEVNFIYFLAFVPLIGLSASLPISFGGLGVREKLGIYLFAFIHPSGTLAAANQFLASIVGILVSLIGGITFIKGQKNLNIGSTNGNNVSD